MVIFTICVMHIEHHAQCQALSRCSVHIHVPSLGFLYLFCSYLTTVLEQVLLLCLDLIFSLTYIPSGIGIYICLSRSPYRITALENLIQYI